MKKFHIAFHGRKVGAIGKMEKFHETIIAENFEEAKRRLYEKYEHITVRNHGEIDIDAKFYGVLHELSKNTWDNAKTNVYGHDGKHKLPALPMAYEGHKYILFEKTILKDGTEYFSDVWTSDDYIPLFAKLKRYSEWWDHVENRNSKGV